MSTEIHWLCIRSYYQLLLIWQWTYSLRKSLQYFDRLSNRKLLKNNLYNLVLGVVFANLWSAYKVQPGLPHVHKKNLTLGRIFVKSDIMDFKKYCRAIWIFISIE
jgi:hypothetical protein